MHRIMQPEDYRHEMVVPANAWYVKFFVWMYDANKNDITFCKLFWGYALLWLLILPRLVGAFAVGVGRMIPEVEVIRHDYSLGKRGQSETCECSDCVKGRRVRYRKTHPTFFMRKVNNVANVAAWLVMHKEAFLNTALVLLCGIFISGLIASIYALVVTWSMHGFIQVLEVIGVSLAGVAVGVALIFALSFLIVWLSRLTFCQNTVKGGALKFRDVMKIGYKSVKGNTCPRVTIKE